MAPGTYSATDPEMLTEDFLQLSRIACNDAGPAAQTLAAVLRMTDCGTTGTTFASQSSIADLAILEQGTVKRHLQRLTELGWLKNHGRELLNGSRHLRRRSITYRLGEKCKHRRPYGPLPRWAAMYLETWSLRVFYAAIVARHMLITTVEANGTGEAYGREQMSLGNLMRETGLDRKSVISAKESLKERNLILVETGVTVHSPDEIRINPDYIVANCFLPNPPLASGNLRPSASGILPPSNLGGSGILTCTPSGILHPTQGNFALGVVEKCAPSLSRTSDQRTTNRNGPKENTAAFADGGSSQDPLDFPLGQAKALLERFLRAGIKPTSQKEMDQLSHICKLVSAGLLAEQFAVSATEGTRLCAKDNPVAYFFTCLRESTKKAGIELWKLEQIKFRKQETSDVA